MKYIGGYFELELPRGRGGWHRESLALNTGRACMAAILQHECPRKVHLPFYMCDALLRPMQEAGVAVEFYALDARLQPVGLDGLDSDGLLVAVNYFGLLSATIAALAQRFGRRLVADHSQAFFERPEPGPWTFYSARKFFGVPDGAYLYAPEAIDIRPLPNPQSDIRHLVNRLIGRQQTGYQQVRRFEQRIDCRIRSISTLSERLLSAIDYEDARARRRHNYLALHARLAEDNLFDATLPAEATPFCYPLLLPHVVDRAALARHRLYVPTLWEDVMKHAAPGFDFERDFAARLLPLPVDHRYQPEDMADAVRRLQKVAKLGKRASG
jgi:hypothetical protein